MQLIQLAFQILIVVGLLVTVYVLRSSLSQRGNEKAVSQWFLEFDAISHGQRWRGIRSQIIEPLRTDRRATGLETELLCVTRSGRWFILGVETKWSQVVNWRISPMADADLAEMLDIEASELDKTRANLTWSTDVEQSRVSTRRVGKRNRTRDSEFQIAATKPSEDLAQIIQPESSA